MTECDIWGVFFAHPNLRCKFCTSRFLVSRWKNAPWMLKFAFFDENRHLEVRIFDLKICSAIFAPHVFPVFFSNPSNSKGFELQWFGKIYIPHVHSPLPCCLGRPENFEIRLLFSRLKLALLRYTRIRRALTPIRAWVVCAYCVIGRANPQS